MQSCASVFPCEELGDVAKGASVREFRSNVKVIS